MWLKNNGDIKMINLPPLTKFWDKGPASGLEFEQLMKKLLIHDGSLKGYVFEPGTTYRDSGIDGIVRKKYPGMRCPVIFQFKWLEGPINKGSAAQQIEKSFQTLLEAYINFESYVLVTPHNFSKDEKKWFERLLEDKKTNITVYHFGHDEIQVLLDAYPVLKKYCYGMKVEGESRSFNVIKDKYRNSINEEVKYLHFIGLPTGSYQKQQLLVKPELAKIYIRLDFTEEIGASSRTILKEILKKSQRVVVLGDPGSGKSTLAKYLASIHCRIPDRDQEPGVDSKIPFIIPIREFMRQQQEKKSKAFNFVDYLKYIADTNYSFNNIDKDFFVALLEMGKAIVLFDGLDEVASESGRTRVSKDIQQFSLQYPDSPVWVTSRVVGYTVDVKLDSEVFHHYYLAPVTTDQTVEFINKWYEIQMPKNETERNGRVHSLIAAIENNPGVQRLKTNPLLLTMMTLVHQFEGTLPDDRARLYEKCIELLLRTWQEQKYMTLGIKNPLEERDLSYNDQLKILAAAAFYIQEKNQKMKEDTRGLIEEEKLAQVLYKARFNKRRMSEEKAAEDICVFLDYIRDRAGLLVEKGRNKRGENVFAFVHLSFLEYLCAYQVAEDKSKSQQQHIDELLTYIGNPAWEEPILLSLYLFTKSTGPSFIDAFSERVFKKLSDNPDINGWFLLGRAVRDNIRFASDDIKQITRQILEIYSDGQQEGIALSILKEIARFSKEGRSILMDVIKESIEIDPARIALKSLYLYSQFNEINLQLMGIISNNKDRSNLSAYSPVYKDNKDNDILFSGNIDQKMKESQWVLYYNSAADKTNESFEWIMSGEINPFKLRGYIISNWVKLFSTFQTRREFLKNNRFQVELMARFRNLCCDFGGYAVVNYPLRLFNDFMENIENLKVSNVPGLRLTCEYREIDREINAKLMEGWFLRILLKTWRTFEKYTASDIPITNQEKKQITDSVIVYSKELSWYFSGKLNFEFNRKLSFELSKELRRNFSQYFGRELKFELREELGFDLSQELSRDFIRDLSHKFSRDFSRYLSKYLSREFSRVFIRDLSRDLSREVSRDLKHLISEQYLKKYNEKLNWGKLTGRNVEMIYPLLIDEFEKENIKLIDGFFEYIYVSILLHKFELLYNFSGITVQSFANERVPTPTEYHYSLLLANPLMIPFTFNLILLAALNHYIFNMFADLNRKFHKKEILGEEIIREVIDDYTDKNPFGFYFIAFSWDFYSKAFNEQSKNLKDREEKGLALAAFVVNAARLSLLAGMPCEGDEWQETLTGAEKSRHPFVQISLSLYRLCNFIDRGENSKVLKEQLEQFKKDYPQYYQLIGFQEK